MDHKLLVQLNGMCLIRRKMPVINGSIYLLLASAECHKHPMSTWLLLSSVGLVTKTKTRISLSVMKLVIMLIA